MTSKERILTVLLGITGVVAAAAIALAANAVSGREIGLSAQPVSLAASGKAPKPAPGLVDDRRGNSGESSDDGPSLLSDEGGGSGSGGDGSSSSSGQGSGGGDDRQTKGSNNSGSGTSGSGTSGSGAVSTSPTTTVEDNSGPGGGGGPGDDGGGHSGPG